MDSVQPVELLKRQYLQLIDPEQLTLPTKALLRSSVIQAQIYHSMFDDSVLKFAPPKRYRLRVLKRLVNAIEDAIVDPEEDVRLLPTSAWAYYSCLALCRAFC